MYLFRFINNLNHSSNWQAISGLPKSLFENEGIYYKYYVIDGVGRVNFRKDFWDLYWGIRRSAIGQFFPQSLEIFPEVFAIVNSAHFPSHF